MPKFAKFRVPFAGILRRGVRAQSGERDQDARILRAWGAAVLRPYEDVTRDGKDSAGCPSKLRASRRYESLSREDLFERLPPDPPPAAERVFRDLLPVAVAPQFGRERFDAFLKAYFDHFAFKSITTEEFLGYLRESLLDRFPGIVSASQRGRDQVIHFVRFG